MKIAKIETISKEKLEKLDKEDIIEQFIDLQNLAVEENEIIRKQNKVIELISKKKYEVKNI